MLQIAWAVVSFARPLVAADAIAAIGEPAGRQLREAGRRLVENARALAQALADGQRRALVAAVPLVEDARRGLSPAERGAHGAASPAAALHWLTRLDEALLVLDRVVHEPRTRVRQR
jgi:signal transduction histidine kinase